MIKLKKIYKRIPLKPIDIFVLFGFVFILLIIFIFFYRKGEFVTIRVKVTDEQGIYTKMYPPAWYANRFEVGDKEIDALGRSTAQITGIDRYNLSSDKKAIYLDIHLKATYDNRTHKYYYKGKDLVYGAPLRFVFSKIAFDCFVSEPPKQSQSKPKSTYVTVIARDRGIDTTLSRTVEPDIYMSIHKGDKIFSSNKTLLAEVLDVKTPPAERITQTINGTLVFQQDPYYKDIFVTASVRVTNLDNEQFMFDSQPLKIGERIPLNFSKVSIFPIIIKIIEQQQ